MRVLVTGSHGFIGSRLVGALKRRGDDVIEWDWRSPGREDACWYPLETQMDEIYHLACINQEVAVTRQRWNIDVNAYSTKRMAEIAAEQGARFVYTSTASVYGDQIKQPIGSLRVPAPKSDYAVAKLAGEWFVRNSGANSVIFRLSNVYGPGQSTENPYCGVVAKFLEAARAGKPLPIIGDGSQTRDFTFVDDVVGHLMNPNLKGVLNCSYGMECSVIELATFIAQELRDSDPDFQWPELEFVPERPIDGIQRRVLRSDVICPTSLPLGLQKTLDWVNGRK